MTAPLSKVHAGLLAIALAAVGVSGCSRVDDGPGTAGSSSKNGAQTHAYFFVDRLAATDLETAEPLRLEARGLPPGERAEVRFQGRVVHPGDAVPTPVSLVLPGFSDDDTTLRVPVEAPLVEALGARHETAAFVGKIVVAFPAKIEGGPPAFATLPEASFQVHPTRKYEEQDQELAARGDRFLERLGITLGFADAVPAVTAVAEGSRAASAGLRSGDRVLRVGPFAARERSDFAPTGRQAEVQFVVERDGALRTVVCALPADLVPWSTKIPPALLVLPALALLAALFSFRSGPRLRFFEERLADEVRSLFRGTRVLTRTRAASAIAGVLAGVFLPFVAFAGFYAYRAAIPGAIPVFALIVAELAGGFVARAATRGTAKTKGISAIYEVLYQFLLVVALLAGPALCFWASGSVGLDELALARAPFGLRLFTNPGFLLVGLASLGVRALALPAVSDDGVARPATRLIVGLGRVASAALFVWLFLGGDSVRPLPIALTAPMQAAAVLLKLGAVVLLLSLLAEIGAGDVKKSFSYLRFALVALVAGTAIVRGLVHLGDRGEFALWLGRGTAVVTLLFALREGLRVAAAVRRGRLALDTVG